MIDTVPTIWSSAGALLALPDEQSKVKEWKAVSFPGGFLRPTSQDTKEKFVWARREFTVTPQQAESLAVLVTLCASYGAMALMPEARKLSVLASGVLGVVVYVAVKWVSGLLEEPQHDEALGKAVSEGRRSEFRAFGWRPEQVPERSDVMDGECGARDRHDRDRSDHRSRPAARPRREHPVPAPPHRDRSLARRPSFGGEPASQHQGQRRVAKVHF